MGIRKIDIAALVVERIESCYPRLAVFSYSEISEWPAGALEYLLNVGILSKADRATEIVCPGCEWQCHKPVIVRQDVLKRSKAFINCDEEPMHGRVNVRMALLAQYATDLNRLCIAMGRMLDLGLPRTLVGANGWVLGQVKGRNGTRVISVETDGGAIQLMVGEESVPLSQTLKWSRSLLNVDRQLVQRLANRKGIVDRRSRAPDRSRQQARKQETRSRDVKIRREVEALVRSGFNRSEAARKIASTPLAHGLTPDRVRRITYEKR